MTGVPAGVSIDELRCWASLLDEHLGVFMTYLMLSVESLAQGGRSLHHGWGKGALRCQVQAWGPGGQYLSACVPNLSISVS